jgi:hypothetical protein
MSAKDYLGLGIKKGSIESHYEAIEPFKKALRKKTNTL